MSVTRGEAGAKNTVDDVVHISANDVVEGEYRGAAWRPAKLPWPTPVGVEGTVLIDGHLGAVRFPFGIAVNGDLRVGEGTRILSMGVVRVVGAIDAPGGLNARGNVSARELCARGRVEALGTVRVEGLIDVDGTVAAWREVVAGSTNVSDTLIAVHDIKVEGELAAGAVVTGRGIEARELCIRGLTRATSEILVRGSVRTYGAILAETAPLIVGGTVTARSHDGWPQPIVCRSLSCAEVLAGVVLRAHGERSAPARSAQRAQSLVWRMIKDGQKSA